MKHIIYIIILGVILALFRLSYLQQGANMNEERKRLRNEISALEKQKDSVRNINEELNRLNLGLKAQVKEIHAELNIQRRKHAEIIRSINDASASQQLDIFDKFTN